jgi:hypothetical protein
VQRIGDGGRRGQAREIQRAADRDRRMRACLTFEDFKETVYKEPFAGGKYIVNGDTAIVDDKRLKEFFDTEVKPPAPTLLILNMVSGMDTVWNQDQKRKLTYCVSDGFGPRRAKVLQDIESATGAWEQVAAVDFVHDAGQDANCTEANTAVVFDVRPVNVNQEYLARAFFPNEPRTARNVLIDESALTLPQDEVLQLAGVLRHELGHTLGFRHEHTRPESGTCFEDRNWRPLSTYDAFSVMHYPQCNGQGDWSLKLTDKDKSGAACVYGPAAGFAFDVTKLPAEAQAKCRPAQPGGPSTGQPQSKVFDAQSVGANVQKAYGPFAVTPGTTFQADISGPVGTGDPDLYVRFTKHRVDGLRLPPVSGRSQRNLRAHGSGGSEPGARDGPRVRAG